MSVKETFDNWYENLSEENKKEVIKHILSSHLSYATEGYHAGPSGEEGALFDGVNAGPSGLPASSLNKNSNQPCRCCGK